MSKASTERQNKTTRHKGKQTEGQAGRQAGKQGSGHTIQHPTKENKKEDKLEDKLADKMEDKLGEKVGDKGSKASGRRTHHPTKGKKLRQAKRKERQGLGKADAPSNTGTHVGRQ